MVSIQRRRYPVDQAVRPYKSDKRMYRQTCVDSLAASRCQPLDPFTALISSQPRGKVDKV